MSDKSRNRERLLRYLSEIVTSTFKVVPADRSASHTFLSRVGIFPTIFVLHLNDLSSD